MARLRLPIALAFAALTLAACSAAPAPGSATPTGVPIASRLPSPTSSRSLSEPATAIVTIRTGGDEEYRILLTDPAAIATAEALADGERDPLIPVGTIVRGDDGGVNGGYGWHIDPASFAWAEMTMEVCDGRPSYVENGTLSGDTFCPWSAEVVSVEPAG